MLRSIRSVLVLTAAVAAAACASTSFNSTWRNPAAEPGNFQGQKVAALVMSTDQSVRFGAEDALARELTARGAVGIPAYSLIPKELNQDKEKAKEFLEKANVVGVVVMRVVGKDQQVTQTAGGMYWGGPAYATFWGGGYYGYGWGGVYSPGYITTDTIVSVEIAGLLPQAGQAGLGRPVADDEPLQGGAVHQGTGRQGGGPDEEGRAHPLAEAPRRARGAPGPPAAEGVRLERTSPS